MKIAVLGANGQLGQEFAILSKSTLSHIEWRFYSKEELDITDDRALEQLSIFEPQYLINAAAYTKVDQAEKDVELAFAINAIAVGQLATLCEAIQCTFIHFSTDYVYDSALSPIREDHPLRPMNQYGRSKLAGESLIQERSTSYFIIRTAWVYSSFGHNFVKTMCRLAKSKSELSVVMDQVGSPTYARDLAQAVLHMIQLQEKEVRPSKIYNYSNIGQVSWFEFAKEIFKYLPNPPQVHAITSDQYPSLVQRPSYSVLDHSAIQSDFPDIPMRDWTLALQACMAEIQHL